MRQSLASRCVWTVCVLLTLSCVITASAEEASQADAKPAAAPADPNVVAVIQDYRITRSEVESRFMSMISPYEGLDVERAKVLTPRDVALYLVAEKAMTIEERKNGGLNDETIQTGIKDFRGRRLANMLAADYLKGKVTVTQDEVKAAMKANPRLDEVAARVSVQSAKTRQLIDVYFNQICERIKLKKMTENYAKAAKIHARLLLKPTIERPMQFIMVRQVQTELTREEKDMVLATFEGGQFTLFDMFNALTNIAPPSRPSDLSTPAGIGRFVDQSLKLPILVVEAEAKGYGKNADFLEQVKLQEDMRLFSKAKMDLYQSIGEPSEAEIKAYFAAHKEEFNAGEKVKIDHIWVDTRAVADIVRKELDAGKDFSEVKQQYSVNKESKPFDTYRSSEGIFGEAIFAADPNTVVGPIKGMFNSDAIKWRVIKVLEKQPGEAATTLDERTAGMVKWKLWARRRADAIEKENAELLEKYDYTLFEDRIKAINPLDIP